LQTPQQIARAEAQSSSGVYGWIFTELMMLKTAKRARNLLAENSSHLSRWGFAPLPLRDYMREFNL